MILAAVGAAKTVASTVSRITKKPADKVAQDQVKDLVPRAINGDTAALNALQHGACCSATNKSKAVFKRALDTVASKGATPLNLDGQSTIGSTITGFVNQLLQPGGVQEVTGAAAIKRNVTWVGVALVAVAAVAVVIYAKKG